MALKSFGQVSKEIPSGIFPDLESDKVPLWLDSSNVYFTDGGVRPIPGQFVAANKLQPLAGTGLIELVQAGEKVVFWGTPGPEGHLYRWAEGEAVVTQVTRTSGGAYAGVGIWSLAAFGETVLATNGIDEPQVYGYTGALTNFQDLYAASGVTGLSDTDTWELLHQFGPFIFAFNTDLLDSGVLWADEDSFIDWLPTAGNAAGDLNIRRLTTGIKAVQELAQGIAVYGTDQLHHVFFVGGQLVHGQRFLLDRVGALGKHSVVSVGNLNFGMGIRGIWRTDGNQVEYIDKNAIHDFVYEDINREHWHKSIAWVNPAIEHVFFSYPSASAIENDKTVGFNWRTGAWTKLDFGRSAATSGEVFDDSLFISSSGNVLIESPTSTGLGEGLPLELTPSGSLGGQGAGAWGAGQGGAGGSFVIAG